MALRVIAVINQKGGVAKTTTAVNLAHALSMRGKRVTLLDMDPQGHVAEYLGVKDVCTEGVSELLAGSSLSSACIVDAREGISLIPTGKQLEQIESIAEGKPLLAGRLKAVVKQLEKTEDYLLIDCPPTSGMLSALSLYVSDEVLVPVNGDYLSLCALSDFVRRIADFEAAMRRSFKLRIAMTRAHIRRKLFRAVKEKVMQYFPNELLATTVRETAALAEAPSFGQTIFEYAPSSNASHDYSLLAIDVDKEGV